MRTACFALVLTFFAHCAKATVAFPPFIPGKELMQACLLPGDQTKCYNMLL